MLKLFMVIKMNKNLERFLKYVKIDTQSDELSNTVPSTLKQLDLAKVLYQELLDLNIECKMSEDGIIMGEIPSNIEKDVPTIGFLAHMDTAMDLTGKDVNPKIIENYNLEDIKLNEDVSIHDGLRIIDKDFEYGLILNEFKVNNTLVAIKYISDDKFIILEKKDDKIIEHINENYQDCIFVEDYDSSMLLASHINLR